MGGGHVPCKQAQLLLNCKRGVSLIEVTHSSSFQLVKFFQLVHIKNCKNIGCNICLYQQSVTDIKGHINMYYCENNNAIINHLIVCPNMTYQKMCLLEFLNYFKTNVNIFNFHSDVVSCSCSLTNFPTYLPTLTHVQHPCVRFGKTFCSCMGNKIFPVLVFLKVNIFSKMNSPFE